MKRCALLAATVAVGGAVAFQGSVNLQGSTPGTAQNGHLHITGKAKAGVFEAISTAPTGITYGGDFRSASSSGRGILGNASATTGATYGGLFQAASNGGRAVAGIAGSSTGTTYGGFFSSLSNQGRGVYGQATSASGTTYGVYGTATSASGYGVYSDGRMHATGVISGNGSGLTNVDAALLGGFASSAFLRSIPVPLNLSGSGAHIIRAQNTGGGGSAAIVGVSSAGNGGSGGRFETNSEDGHGLLGLSTSTIGTTAGVYGQAASFEGYGVFGNATSASGTGVFGQAQAATGTNYGVYGRAASASGYGVYSEGRMHSTGVISGNGSGLTNVNAAQLGGLSSSAFLQTVPVPLSLSGGQFNEVLRVENTNIGASSSNGIVGISNASAAWGIWGVANGNFGKAIVGFAGGSGTTAGGSFAANSSGTDTAGVIGEASAGSGVTYGVWGQSASTTGYGTIGIATATTGANYGVYGRTASPSGWSLFAQGNFAATGPKAFRIDHPFDPENKYLLHYAAESPKPQNFYVGNVVTDARGYAWVTLPDYFSEINTNFKYQLTVVRDDESLNFVQAQVGKKVKNGRFLIMSSAPNTEVSWRIDADRNDLYVRNRPPKEVVDKEGPEKGTYQHPEFYGLGAERGLLYHAPEQKRENKPPSRR